MEKKTVTKVKSGTVLRRCKCEHAFQDSRYGKGMRVFNLSQKSSRVRCTVCSTSVSVE